MIKRVRAGGIRTLLCEERTPQPSQVQENASRPRTNIKNGNCKLLIGQWEECSKLEEDGDQSWKSSMDEKARRNVNNLVARLYDGVCTKSTHGRPFTI